MGKRVAGQKEAITALSDAVRRSRAGLQSKRPIGSFIFLKEQRVSVLIGKALAEYLFNDEAHGAYRYVGISGTPWGE